MKNLMKSLIPSTRDKISAFFSLLFIAVLSAYLSSCSDNATNPEETDDQFIENIVKAGYSSSREDDDLMYNETNDMNDDGAVPDLLIDGQSRR